MFIMGYENNGGGGGGGMQMTLDELQDFFMEEKGEDQGIAAANEDRQMNLEKATAALEETLWKAGLSTNKFFIIKKKK